MDCNYKNKFNKYLIKYNQLKSQYGGGWSCKVCTYHNKEPNKLCEMCGTPYFTTQEDDIPSVSSDASGPAAAGPAASGPSATGLAASGPAAAGPATRAPTISIEEIIRNIKLYYNRPDTFIIFTTGMADKGIRDFWFGLTKNHLFNIRYINHLLQLIPSKFTNIRIFHFDPDFFEYSDLEQLYSLTAGQPHEIGNKRYKESSFYNHSFPFQRLDFSKLNHFLIDFAHIFNYDTIYGFPITSSHYSHMQEYKKGIKLPNLKSIYFGYLGGIDTYNQILAFSNFIFFKPDGKVITYIDKMIEKNFTFNTTYPNDAIINYVNKLINKTLEPLFRKKYPTEIIFYDTNFNKATHLIIYMLTYFIDSFFIRNNYNKDEFIELIKIAGNEYFSNIERPLL